MCGRFIITTAATALRDLFGTRNALPNFRPRYNAAPTDQLPIILRDRDTGERHLNVLRWGLIPFWARDAKIGYSTINAKAETVAEKPAFREAFNSRRCLVPADGFYEWHKVGAKAKQPYRISMRDGATFAFAGLWERWNDRASGELVRSFTIVTTTPNAICAPIHDRMPVILEPSSYGQWLGDEPADAVRLLMMLRPYPAERMTAYPVSARVGNVRNDDAALIEPIAVA
jgi:putative SOS response-associated peptidase YedK